MTFVLNFKMPTMQVFSLAIYIGVCCSASENADNEGCPDLNTHTTWKTIGPHIHNVTMLTERAVVYCQTGYQAYLNLSQVYSDQFVITCKNGSWDVGSVCQERGCPDLNNHSNWDTIGPNIKNIRMLPAGRAVVYCQTGYQAYLILAKLYNDHFPITCKTGSWDVGGSVCQEKAVNCPDPTNDLNQTIWQHTLPFNFTKTTTRYIVQCEPGYDAVVHGFNGYHDSIAATCNHDKWEVNTVCSAIECGDPNNYSNWQNSEAAERIHPIVYHETTLNSSAIVHCLAGDVVYSLDGHRTRDYFNIACTSKHRWQEDGKCGCRQLKLKSNWDDIGPNINTVTQLETPDNATVLCKIGYDAYNPQQGEILDHYNLTCVNGSWTNNSFCQEKDCHSPPVLKNGHPSFSKTTYKSTVTYACNSGYAIHGKIFITCQDNGQWDTLEANCKIKDCGTPPVLANGHRTFLNTTVNSTVAYSCNTGYDLRGMSSMRCLESGSWSILDTLCILKDCQSPPILLNGHSIVSKTTYNSTATYACNSGYEIHGKNSITCQGNGKWDIPEATCTIKATTSVATTISASTAYNWMTTTQQTTTTMSTSTSPINTTVLGCVNLLFSEHWETVGPNIQHIRIMSSPNHAMVYCQPEYSAFLASQHVYSDRFQIICRDGAWKSHSIFQKIDAVHLIG